MKIGFFTDTYLPDINGVVTSIETSKRTLEERGHEVSVVVPKVYGYKDKNKNIYRLTSIQASRLPPLRFALEIPEKSLFKIMQIPFDVIHSHAGLTAITFLGWRIARIRNIPYILTYHTLWSRYTHYFLGLFTPGMMIIISKYICNLADCIIAPTEKIKKELISYGIHKKIYVLPTGIIVEDFQNVEKGFLRKKLHIPDTKKILLYVGRFGKEKSVDFLIDTFKQIKKSYDDCVFVLVGEGQEKENLLRQTKELGLTDDVFILDSFVHEEMPKVYADADLLVFSSQTETQGLVVLEAFASGIPVIAVEDDALKEVINDGKNGFIVKRDQERFAEKVIQLLTNDKLYQLFTENARQTANKFSEQEIARRLEIIYNEVNQQKRKKSTRQYIMTVLRERMGLKKILEITNHRDKKDSLAN